MMKVSIDAFYAWVVGKTYWLSEQKKALAEKVKEVFYLHRQRYRARRIAAELQTRMTAQLVIDTFNRGRKRGLTNKGAIIHTDRGSQYAGVEYRRLLYINFGLQKSNRI
jgi:transposase InsO family protein